MKRGRFGRPTHPTNKFVYGCSGPMENEKLVFDQLWAQSVYRNDLVSINREHNRQWKELGTSPEVEELKVKLEIIENELGTLLVGTGKRKRLPKCPEKRKAAKDLIAICALLRARFKVAKAAAKKDATLQKEALNNQTEAAKASARIKARQELGLAWGNSAICEINSWKLRNYKSYDGTGTIQVQFQGGDTEKSAKRFTVMDLLSGKDLRATLEYLDLSSPTRGLGVKRSRNAPSLSAKDIRLGRRLAKLRIAVAGQDHSKRVSGKNPRLYTEVIVKLHRPLPESGWISWISLVRRAAGTKRAWTAQFSIATRGVAEENRLLLPEDVVACDIGWRMVDRGETIKRKDGTIVPCIAMRVAMFGTRNGPKEELVLPGPLVEKMKYVDTLQSIRDNNFNSMRTDLSAWMKENTIPDWLKERTKTLANWKSIRRLAKVAIEWKGNRWVGDDQIYAQLESWRKQDKHLLDWQEGMRTRMRRWRLDIYRKFMKRLRETFSVCGLEDFNLVAFSQKEKTGKRSNWQRSVAGLSFLRSILDQTMKVVKIPAAYTSKDCHLCGHRNELDPFSIMQTCKGCGAVWDRDKNAVDNIYDRTMKALGFETYGDAKKAA